MPKMLKALQKTVADAEAVSGDFELLAPGRYVACLNKVEAKNSAAGNPMWVWEFNEIRDMDGNKKPGRLWYNTMIPQAKMPSGVPDSEKWETAQRLSAGRLKAAFEAFGYTLDSDTDEMIGDKIVLAVGVDTIQKGPKAGQQTNRVNALHSADDVDLDSDEDDDTY